MHNMVVWFEIPVKDLKRAAAFYSKVLEIQLTEMEFGEGKMAMFPHEPGSVSGALVHSPYQTPSEQGTMVYLNGGEDLTVPLNRIEKAGGKIITGKTSIGPHGFIAIFKDTEGNRVALHSMK